MHSSLCLISACRSSGSLSGMIRDASNSYVMWLAHLIDWPAHWLSMLGEKPVGGSVCLVFEEGSALTLTAQCSHICTRLSKCIYSIHFRIWCKICLTFEAFFTCTIFAQTHNKKYLNIHVKIMTCIFYESDLKIQEILLWINLMSELTIFTSHVYKSWK